MVRAATRFIRTLKRQGQLVRKRTLSAGRFLLGTGKETVGCLAANPFQTGAAVVGGPASLGLLAGGCAVGGAIKQAKGLIGKSNERKRQAQSRPARGAPSKKAKTGKQGKQGKKGGPPIGKPSVFVKKITRTPKADKTQPTIAPPAKGVKRKFQAADLDQQTPQRPGKIGKIHGRADESKTPVGITRELEANGTAAFQL